MKYYKSLKYDIVQGICREAYMLIPWILITLLFCMDFAFRVTNWKSTSGYQGAVHYTDYLMFILGGMEVYVPSQSDPFVFPVIWMVTMVFMSYVTLQFPYNNLMTHGQQLLVRMRSRRCWWISKCIWIIIKTSLFYAVFYGIVLLVCKLQGGVIEGLPDAQYLSIVSSFHETNVRGIADFRMSLFVMPLLMSIAFNILQLFVSLFIKPIFGFVVTMVLLIASAYLPGYWLLGNYGMPIRSAAFTVGGVNEWQASVFTVGMIIVVSIAGCISFKKIDILKKG